MKISKENLEIIIEEIIDSFEYEIEFNGRDDISVYPTISNKMKTRLIKVIEEL